MNIQKKIAFIYTAEPYQCYHAASVASILSAFPDCCVTEYFSFNDSLTHLKTIRNLFNQNQDLTIKPFVKSFITGMLHITRRLDTEKTYLLKDNINELNQYDAIIATENPAGELKNLGLSGPKLFLIQHGAGDRKVADEYLVRNFDYTLFPGPKIRDYFIKAGFSTPDTSTNVGYPKFDILEATQKRQKKLFHNEKPIVLYNPHYKKSQGSLYKWGNKIISTFKEQSSRNLIVAPHVKMFHEGYYIREFLLKRWGTPEILIDTGTENSVNMTYTTQASIYVGDVSSQVYEFVIKPRPCVFLNPHKIKWQDDPHFLHWNFGEVVDRVEDILPAIERAQERHYLYRDTQIKIVKETFGDLPLFGASERAAKAILNYLDNL